MPLSGVEWTNQRAKYNDCYYIQHWCWQLFSAWLFKVSVPLQHDTVGSYQLMDINYDWSDQCAALAPSEQASPNNHQRSPGAKQVEWILFTELISMYKNSHYHTNMALSMNTTGLFEILCHSLPSVTHSWPSAVSTSRRLCTQCTWLS